jgi:hypothetical protein
MTEDIFCNVIFPHILHYAPHTRVLVFDSATSHVTDKVFESVKRHGLIVLVIPAKCTPILQALDVKYFMRYRFLHNKLICAAIDRLGVKKFQQMTAAEKRAMLCVVVEASARLLSAEIPVEEIFLEMGYLKPSVETIKLQNFPEYKYSEPAEADFNSFIERVAAYEATVSGKRTALDLAVQEICAVPIAEKSGTRKRGRPKNEEAAQKKGPRTEAKKQQTLQQSWSKAAPLFTAPAPIEGEKEMQHVTAPTIVTALKEPSPPSVQRKTLGLKVMPNVMMDPVLTWWVNMRMTWISQILTLNDLNAIVCAADHLVQIVVDVRLRVSEQRVFIVNSMKSSEKGSHWVTFFIYEEEGAWSGTLVDSLDYQLPSVVGLCSALRLLLPTLRIVSHGLQKDTVTCGSWCIALCQLCLISKSSIREFCTSDIREIVATTIGDKPWKWIKDKMKFPKELTKAFVVIDDD